MRWLVCCIKLKEIVMGRSPGSLFYLLDAWQVFPTLLVQQAHFTCNASIAHMKNTMHLNLTICKIIRFSSTVILAAAQMSDQQQC